MADNIAIRIALEGAAEVQARLKQIGLDGDAALKRLQQAAGGVVPAFNNVGQGVDRMSGQVTRGAAIINGFQAALAGIRPIAASAGAQIGALGAFAGAGRAGVLGLAAAITAGLLVALARAGDGATIARQRLSDLLNSRPRGGNAFDQLGKDAKKLGTDVSNLLPAFEQLVKAQQKLRPLETTPTKREVVDENGVKRLEEIGKLTPGLEEARRAIAGLFAALKQGGADGETAGKALEQFFKSVSDNGRLTTDALKALQDAAPRAANAVAQGFGRSNAGDLLKDLARGAKISADDVVSSAARMSDALISDFQKAQERSRTFGSALEELGATSKRAAQDLAGAGLGGAATGAVDSVRNAVQGASDAVKQFAADNPQTIKAVGDAFRLAFQALPGALSGPLGNIVQQIGAIWPLAQQGATAFVDHVQQVFQSLVSDISSAAQSIGQALSSGFQGAQGAFDEIRNAIAAVGNSLGEAFQNGINTANAAIQGLVTAFQQVQSGVNGVIENIKQVFSSLVSALQSIGQSAGQALLSGFESAAQSILQLIDRIKAAWAAISNPNGGAEGENQENLGEPLGFARGGFTGHGGKYEPAGIVHRGEYVEPQHVVRQPGVLNFLELLRRYGGDLQKAFASFGMRPRGYADGGLVTGMQSAVRVSVPKDLFRGFSMGGLVTGLGDVMVTLPGFAEGGLVAAAVGGTTNAMHPVTINLGNGRSVSGLQAPADIVRALQKEAVVDRLRSSRVPSRGSAR